MVDADEREAPGERDRLGGLNADEQRADQAWTVGDGDRVDLGER
jgi:hypothetical protein